MFLLPPLFILAIRSSFLNTEDISENCPSPLAAELKAVCQDGSMQTCNISPGLAPSVCFRAQRLSGDSSTIWWLGHINALYIKALLVWSTFLWVPVFLEMVWKVRFWNFIRIIQTFMFQVELRSTFYRNVLIHSHTKEELEKSSFWKVTSSMKA